MRKFTSDHVWIQREDGANHAVVGITVHAQEALGDIVFVEFPEPGKVFAKGDVAAVVESVKAAADVYIPVAGTVTGTNDALRDDPSLANTDPLGVGWFFTIEVQNPAEFDALMNEAAYAAFSANA
jgi:glycine cleavage system H protein